MILAVSRNPLISTTQHVWVVIGRSWDQVGTKLGPSRSEFTGVVAGEVTGEVRRLLAVMSGEMRRREIQEALGLKHEDHFRDAYLLPAMALGAVEMTQPDKPRSSKQRHRLTEQGEALRDGGGE